ncbi:hypothetical protein ccbrp13_20830 [Ktedonobacteria bacterium brp13]|nr:hypothetical protein ccbrp13_20830 [Ktedonobacteria bacterium brp13]
MSTPKGMKCVPQTVGTADKVLIYSDAAHIILQLRHQVPTEEQILEPSFKIAVSLTPAVIWRKIAQIKLFLLSHLLMKNYMF